MTVRFDIPLRKTTGRRIRIPPGAPAAPLYDTTLSFAASLTQSAAGLTATATGSLDADEAFEFNALANPGGVPTTMTLTISAVEVCQVDFPADYLTLACRYTSKTGAQYTTTFQSGTVAI